MEKIMSLTNKQQKFIRGAAQKIKSTAQIGKKEITEASIESFRILIEANELVKIHLLSNALLTKKEAIVILTDTLRVDYGYSIGNQIVIYKKSYVDEKQVFSKLVEAIK
ncbi:MAG: YhbY family RNA-binding protein [Culicoidibacterales bacterium]